MNETVQYDGKTYYKPINSHYVPRRHYKRFIDKKSSYAFVLKKGAKRPETTNKFEHVGALVNFYTTSGDPRQDEDILERDESLLGDAIDILISGNTVSEDSLRLYVSILNSRSILNRLVVKEALKECNIEKDPKDFQKWLIAYSKTTLGKYPLKDFTVEIIKSNGEKFITSDNPVIVYKADFVKVLVKEMDDLPKTELYDYVRYYCPVNPEYCIQLRHKCDNYQNEIEKSSIFINTLVVGFALEAICYQDKIAPKLVEMFNDPTNPLVLELNCGLAEEKEIAKEIEKHYREMKRKHNSQ